MPKIIFALLFLAAPLAQATTDSASEADRQFVQLHTQEWAFRIKEFPHLAANAGVNNYADQLMHVSGEHQLRRYHYWQNTLKQLKNINCKQLTRENCINYRIFRRQLINFSNNYETRAYLFPFNSDWAWYIGWARLADGRFNKAEDYRNYLAKLEKLPAVNREYLDLLEIALKEGMTQPQAVLSGRDEAISKQIVDTPEDSVFYKPFMAERPVFFTDEEWQALQQRAKKQVVDSVVPVYTELLKFMQEKYYPAARQELAATTLPGGEAFYRAKIYKYATVDMSPKEIHQLGLSEVKRIRADMDAVIKETRFEGSFAEFLQFLRSDEQFYASSARELLAEASYWAKKIDGKLPEYFSQLPRQPYGITPVPAAIAPFFTTGRYVGGAYADGKAGFYWVNTYNLKQRPLYTLPALTLHEAVPGHHLQAALASELKEQPAFRRSDYISAYGEGWALYTEKLGVEMGIYETPYQEFGRLTYEMWRACRLVIDTGIHAFGWTRQQAIDYLAGNTALALHNVKTEVDRYISWPGQALSYKLGEYTIWQLRHKAEASLTDQFNLRDFHDFILGLGSVPLDVLKDEFEFWLKQQQN
ncbi:MAG: DUF885 domain-containing protein [Xanthomonadales bacterium]|nr:DUF885 domain-containing protein [Xanthomonadales bacterium]